MSRPLTAITDTTRCPDLRGTRGHYPLMHDSGPVTMPGPDDEPHRRQHVMLALCGNAWLVPPPDNNGDASQPRHNCDDCDLVVHEQRIAQLRSRAVA